MKKRVENADRRQPVGLFFPTRVQTRGTFLPVILAAFVMAGCARPPAPDHLLRADPGQVARLERQSMLRAAPSLARIVSGSDLAWRRPAAPVPSPELSEGAAMWLFVEPQTLLSRDRGALAELALPEHLSLLADLGFSGLFVAPLESSGRDRHPERSALEPDVDIISFELSATAGAEEDFQHLAAGAAEKKLFLGSAVPPLFTGAGPDFLLALKAAGDWPGAYIMLEAPPEAESELPSAGQLDAPLRDSLSARGVLPAGIDFGESAGWAVSGPERGVDGRTRRWFYLFHETPNRPVLNWDDPSGAARRLLSAGIIRQVGLRRVLLAGVRPGPLLYSNSREAPFRNVSSRPEPGLSALRDLCREIRRYGGRPLLLDRVPASLGGLILDTECDLITDNVTCPAAEYALLSGDAAPLRAALDRTLAEGADQRRFCRLLSTAQPLDFALLAAETNRKTLLFPDLVPEQTAEGWKRSLYTQSGSLQATLPALAAMRAGLSPTELSEANREKIQPLHEIVMLLRAGLPGVLGLSGQDLAGVVRHTALPPKPEAPAPRPALPAWSPGPEMQASTAGGMPRGLAVYAPPLLQAAAPGSFAATVRGIAALRRETGVAAGTLLARLPTIQPGSVAFLVRLPDGDLLLTAANFSDKVVCETFSRPRYASEQADDLLRNTEIDLAGNRFTLQMRPFECRLLRIAHNT